MGLGLLQLTAGLREDFPAPLRHVFRLIETWAQQVADKVNRTLVSGETLQRWAPVVTTPVTFPLQLGLTMNGTLSAVLVTAVEAAVDGAPLSGATNMALASVTWTVSTVAGGGRLLNLQSLPGLAAGTTYLLTVVALGVP